MADSRIINLPYNSTPSSSDILPVVTNYQTTKVSVLNAIKGAGITPSETSSYIYIKVKNGATDNGTLLLNTYNSAKSKTPNGSSLSSTNRLIIILPPGVYDLGNSSLNLDTEFIDLIGLTKDSNHVVITSNNNTVVQTANDVRVIGLSLNNTGYNNYSWSVSSNLSSTYWENIIFNNRISCNNLSGTFKNCVMKDNSQVYVCSGTFINCSCNNSFCSNGTASGVFLNCSGNNCSLIGYNTESSGTFTNCKSFIVSDNNLNGGFLGAFANGSGVFINCSGSVNYIYGAGGFTGAYSVLGGIFLNCYGYCYRCGYGGGFLGGSSTASGTFTNCVGVGSNIDFIRTGSFGGWNCYMSGKFNNCQAKMLGEVLSGDFGGSGYCLGQFVNCIISDPTLPNLTNSGDPTKPACYINCFDGSGRLVNGNA